MHGVGRAEAASPVIRQPTESARRGELPGSPRCGDLAVPHVASRRRLDRSRIRRGLRRIRQAPGPHGGLRARQVLPGGAIRIHRTPVNLARRLAAHAAAGVLRHSDAQRNLLRSDSPRGAAGPLPVGRTVGADRLSRLLRWRTRPDPYARGGRDPSVRRRGPEDPDSLRTRIRSLEATGSRTTSVTPSALREVPDTSAMCRPTERGRAPATRSRDRHRNPHRWSRSGQDVAARGLARLGLFDGRGAAVERRLQPRARLSGRPTKVRV